MTNSNQNSGNSTRAGSKIGNYLFYALTDIAIVAIGLFVLYQMVSWERSSAAVEGETVFEDSIHNQVQQGFNQLEGWLANYETAGSDVTRYGN